MNYLVEETMIEIARILGIAVDGKIEEVRACIRWMIGEEFGCKTRTVSSKSKKKPKGYRELSSLASSINYNHRGCG